MTRKSYFAPASEVKLLAEGDEKIAPLVQILRTGLYKHPDYGDFNVTRQHLSEFVKNFTDKVRGIDIAVDYKHDNDDVAAGWIQELLILDEDKLMARVKWTPNGTKVLADAEFRYLSGEFDLNYKDLQTGNKFGATLLGAGLTNRPFIKGMEPVVQLSEKIKEGAFDMNELEKAQARVKELEANEAKLKLAETNLEAANKKLAEKDDADKKLADEKKLSEKKAAFDKKLSEGTVCEAQRESFMANDMDKFLSLAQPVKVKKLSESENSATDDGKGDEDESAEDAILKLADAVRKEKKCDQGKAISIVLADPANKALRTKYEAKSKQD